MAKFASREEKPFSPISQKLLDAVSGPVQPGHSSSEKPEETPKVIQIRAKPEDSSQVPPLRVENLGPEIEAEERLTTTMRYHVSPQEKEDTEEFIRRLSMAAKIRLTHSNIMRACRDILFQVEDRLVTELSKARLKRPINDKRAIAFFESRLTDIIQTAVRQSPLPYARSGRE